MDDRRPQLFQPGGGACDDGDSCTVNDTLDANCHCAGTLVDMDGDGLCAALDCNDNDPAITDTIPNCCLFNPVPDCDGDGTPDDMKPDCDGDGIPDSMEPDSEADGVPDDCDICPGYDDHLYAGLYQILLKNSNGVHIERFIKVTD